MATRTTGKALIDFWQSPLVENRVSARTAADLATACREVLSANSEGESVNVRTSPVDDLLDQFAKGKGHHRAQTLAAYKSRFRKAVRLYLAYIDDPDEWPEAGKVPNTEGSKLDSGLREYRFPLRAGLMVPLALPLDLNQMEVKRLAAFIESLVVGT